MFAVLKLYHGGKLANCCWPWRDFPQISSIVVLRQKHLNDLLQMSFKSELLDSGSIISSCMQNINNVHKQQSSSNLQFKVNLNRIKIWTDNKQKFQIQQEVKEENLTLEKVPIQKLKSFFHQVLWVEGFQRYGNVGTFSLRRRVQCGKLNAGRVSFWDSGCLPTDPLILYSPGPAQAISGCPWFPTSPSCSVSQIWQTQPPFA